MKHLKNLGILFTSDGKREREIDNWRQCFCLCICLRGWRRSSSAIIYGMSWLQAVGSDLKNKVVTKRIRSRRALV